MENILEVKNVNKIIEGKEILKNLSFSLPKNKIVAFLGPNVAGKTTTLKIGAGLLKQDSGEILILANKDSLHKTSHPVMFIPDYPLLYEELTGFEYIEMMISLFEIKLKNPYEDLALYDMDNELPKKIKNFSLGNKKKIALFTTLLSKPSLLLLDEFISGIDPLNMKIIKTILRDYANRGNAVLLSTHQLEVAQHFCDTLILIKNGEILEENMSITSVTDKYSTLEDYFLSTLRLTEEDYE